MPSPSTAFTSTFAPFDERLRTSWANSTASLFAAALSRSSVRRRGELRRCWLGARRGQTGGCVPGEAPSAISMRALRGRVICRLTQDLLVFLA